MRRAILLLAASIFGLAGAASAGQLQTIQSWYMLCDNARGCTALGFARTYQDAVAYVRIERPPGARVPAVVVGVIGEHEPGPVRLQLTIDGKAMPDLLDGQAEDEYQRAVVPADAVRPVVDALLRAKSLSVQIDPNGKPVAVPLDGLRAALTSMDSSQGLFGSPDAFVLKNAMPVMPTRLPEPPPSIAAQPITLLASPLPNPPDGLDAPIDCGAPEAAYLAYALGPDVQLWGVCVDHAAYNDAYAFFLVRPGQAVQPVSFAIPGSGFPASDTLTNPALSDDGKRLTAFGKGNGFGACGDRQDWAWDGKELQPVLERYMPDCVGIPEADWLVSYRATVR